MELEEGLSGKQKVEYLSLGAGGILQFFGISVYVVFNPSLGAAIFIAGLIAAFLPYGLYTYFHGKKISKVEQEFPNFLKNLSESRKSGMSVSQSFRNAANSDYGELDSYVRKAANQLSWGITFPEVMKNFQKSLKESSIVARSISVILQSYRSGGDVAETMDSIAEDANKIKSAEKERKSVLTQQVFIIYAIYFLFIGILVALYKILVPLLEIGGGGFMGTPPNFCNSVIGPVCSLCPTFFGTQGGSRLCYYKAIFLVMIVVEGFFNGLVAGEVRSGDIASGFKHIMIMLPVGFISYVGALRIMG
ncbi:MAG: type II secretion system F family protein [Candidatus Nanohaloarchaeota archaeon QJJ-9]|nr:type II secretion system F family protein [Candidatus Nanohaloarchaeota archaeon QJJ-9]